MQNSAKINYPKVAGGHCASYRLVKNLYSHRVQNRLASATSHSAFSAGFAPPVLHRNSGQDSRKVETSCTETPAANGVLSPRNEKKIIFSFVFRIVISNIIKIYFLLNSFIIIFTYFFQDDFFLCFPSRSVTI